MNHPVYYKEVNTTVYYVLSEDNMATRFDHFVVIFRPLN